jgi:DNA-binding response OmpR family regulator
MKNKTTLPATETNGLPRQCPATPLKRILVVHDDGDIRQLSTEVLIRSGYQVDAAADGATAWEALNTDSYDLLITDYEMPKVSGVDLLQKLHAVRKALPVIVASATMPQTKFTHNPWLQPAVTLLMPYTVAEFLGTVKELLRLTDGVHTPITRQPNRPNRAAITDLQTGLQL